MTEKSVWSVDKKKFALRLSHASVAFYEAKRYALGDAANLEKLGQRLNDLIKKGVEKSYLRRRAKPNDDQILWNDNPDESQSVVSSNPLDQFYTPVAMARSCYKFFCNTLKSRGVRLEEYTFIEPSAGTGAFYKLFPPGRRLGFDVAPKCPGVVKQDFLKYMPQPGKFVICGNPPFGSQGFKPSNGNDANAFIQHGLRCAEYVGFILPQAFKTGYRFGNSNQKLVMPIAGREFDRVGFVDDEGQTISKLFVGFYIFSREMPMIRTCDSFVRIRSILLGKRSSHLDFKYRDLADFYVDDCHFVGVKSGQRRPPLGGGGFLWWRFFIISRRFCGCWRIPTGMRWRIVL